MAKIHQYTARPKKSSLVSGNRLGDLSLTRPHNRMCIRMHIFNFKKQTSKKKKKKEKKICDRPGEDSSCHPHF